jgi:hypothetical protein
MGNYKEPKKGLCFFKIIVLSTSTRKTIVDKPIYDGTVVDKTFLSRMTTSNRRI